MFPLTNILLPALSLLTHFLLTVYKCLNFFKIRPSLTTSKEGLKTLNIHCKQQGFNSGFGWSVVKDNYDQDQWFITSLAPQAIF